MERHFIISIGRQFGSGGKQVALALGQMLGVPVYDSELISRAAQESGISRSAFEPADEERKSLRLGLFHGSFGDVELFNIQSETIRNIAASGSAVIVGRCSDYVLRDMEGTLDVFITAPLDRRIERVSQRTGLAPDKAKSLIVKKDKARASYYDCFTFGNWGVAGNYDLCVDSSILGTEGTAEFIIDFARKAGIL